MNALHSVEVNQTMIRHVSSTENSSFVSVCEWVFFALILSPPILYNILTSPRLLCTKCLNAFHLSAFRIRNFITAKKIENQTVDLCLASSTIRI